VGERALMLRIDGGGPLDADTDLAGLTKLWIAGKGNDVGRAWITEESAVEVAHFRVAEEYYREIAPVEGEAGIRIELAQAICDTVEVETQGFTPAGYLYLAVLHQRERVERRERSFLFSPRRGKQCGSAGC